MFLEHDQELTKMLQRACCGQQKNGAIDQLDSVVRRQTNVGVDSIQVVRIDAGKIVVRLA